MVERGTGRLVGILTNRDVRFATDPAQRVYELMTRENLITVPGSVAADEARRLLHRNGWKNCWWWTKTTLRRADHRQGHGQGHGAPPRQQGRIGAATRAAAVGVGEDGALRARALIDAGVDVLVIDTAHGHSAGVIAAVGRVKQMTNSVQVMAGNVATPQGALALIKAGADSIKIGIGTRQHLHHPRGRGRRRAAILRRHGNRRCLPRARRPVDRRWRRPHQRRPGQSHWRRR